MPLIARIPSGSLLSLLSAPLDYLDVINTKDVPIYPHGIDVQQSPP